MRRSAKQSLACLATLYFAAGLPHAAVSQRLEPDGPLPALAKPGAAKVGPLSPYGGLAPLTPSSGPPPPWQIDALIAVPALPLSRFATPPHVAPDRPPSPRPPPSPPPPRPPPQAGRPRQPPPPRRSAEGRDKARPIKVVRRPKAPARPQAAPAAPVTMPSLLEPTWH